MTKKEITINGKQYPVIFDMQTIMNFEEVTGGKSFFTENLTTLKNRIALIIAAVTAADENRMSQTTQAMQGLLSGTISTQINNVLNSAINNNNWNFGANISTGDEGWHNAEYEGLLSGRLLNNRLLINGQFGYRDNPRTASSSFIGDFDVRYLLIPNGNLALKVYNQTNDRYFTKSSLNTQGVGLIMKKDFINLKDLFKRKKKTKKTSK